MFINKCLHFYLKKNKESPRVMHLNASQQILRALRPGLYHTGLRDRDTNARASKNKNDGVFGDAKIGIFGNFGNAFYSRLFA